MKVNTVASLCGVLIVAAIASNVLSQPSIAAATKNITSTTSKVEQAAVSSSEKASALGAAISSNDASLQERLKEFERSTNRLNRLDNDLQIDLGAYQNAAISALQRFDEQAQGIKDPGMLQKMQLLRQQAEQEQNALMTSATETLALLHNVLAKGNDLQRAANCVIIANELHNEQARMHGELMDARRAANEYQSTTNALLARISTILVAKS
jgi:hypothetical protein